MRTITVALTLAAAAAALSACAAPSVADGQQNTTPMPSVTVPAPNGGSIDQVVPDATPAATQQVAIDQPAQLSDGVVVSVANVQNVDVSAETPGEVAGPAVAVALNVQNNSSSAIDLSTAMVSATNSGGMLGQPTVASPATPLTGSLAAGAAATGTYVFMFPADQRAGLSITVEYIAGAPIALFIG